MCFGPRRAELAVLDVLVPGAMLTADQIARQARLTRCRTRWAIARLERRALIVNAHDGTRWSATPRGRFAAGTERGGNAMAPTIASSGSPTATSSLAAIVVRPVVDYRGPWVRRLGITCPATTSRSGRSCCSDR